jgi:hypothetical protein
MQQRRAGNRKRGGSPITKTSKLAKATTIMDYSQLTDEQLLQLLEGVLRETVKRGDIVTAAAREVMLTEKEKTDIKAAAAQQAKSDIYREESRRLAQEERDRLIQQQRRAAEKDEADKQARLWQAKKEQSARMIALLKGEIWVNVWKSRSGEKRVYLNDGEPFGKRTNEIACLYVTGSSRQAPGSMDESSWLKAYDDDTRKAVKALCVEMGKYWNETTIHCNQAATYEPAN